jgi:hypothetical protein
LFASLIATALCQSPSPPILKVATFRNGSITIDGVRATAGEVDGKFRELSEKKGILWYYREDPMKNPTPNVWAIVNACRKYHIIHRLSESPTYSDLR